MIDRGPNHQTRAELSPPPYVLVSHGLLGTRFRRRGLFDFARSRSAEHQLLGEKPVEGFDGGELVVFDIEDGVELGDVENVVDFLAQVQQF